MDELKCRPSTGRHQTAPHQPHLNSDILGRWQECLCSLRLCSCPLPLENANDRQALIGLLEFWFPWAPQLLSFASSPPMPPSSRSETAPPPHPSSTPKVFILFHLLTLSGRLVLCTDASWAINTLRSIPLFQLSLKCELTCFPDVVESSVGNFVFLFFFGTSLSCLSCGFGRGAMAQAQEFGSVCCFLTWTFCRPPPLDQRTFVFPDLQTMGEVQGIGK